MSSRGESGYVRAMPRHGRLRTVAIAVGLAAVLLFALVAGQALGSGAHKHSGRASASVRFASRTFHLSQPDQKQRFTVGCPGSSLPLGGGMTSNPPPGVGGEGVYPHSY